MRTTKPISTISFNSENYLKGKLDELIKAKKISAYHFIRHEPEEDEKKQHFHVWLLPTKMLQTDDIRDELKEFDPVNPSKPLGCLPFESSDFDNWYLYVLHDPRYLSQKGQARKYHYHRDMVVTSDEDYLDEQIRRIDLLRLSPYQDMMEAIEHNVTWEDYFSRGTVPLPQINQFQNAWFLLRDHYYATKRAQSEGHPDEAYPDSEKPSEDENLVFEDGKVINAVTGEIIE